MGLGVEVGILSDLKDNDPEGFEEFSTYFSQVRVFLQDAGLPTHTEPLDIEVSDWEMVGYSGLHCLRRIAAHLDAGRELPAPGDTNAVDDPILADYFKDATGQKQSFLASFLGKKRSFGRSFDHLIVHSDAEGFYLPIPFDSVLMTPEDLAVPGGMIGSSIKLLEECKRLASALHIPDEIDSSSEQLWSAVESQGHGESTWTRYGVESFTCIALREACSKSIDDGAAVVFV